MLDDTRGRAPAVDKSLVPTVQIAPAKGWPQGRKPATASGLAVGAQVAALGLAAAGDTALPAPFAYGMFIGLQGSWSRKPPVGYKVVFVPFQDGKPNGMPVDVMTGFVSDRGEAQGRPVGVALDRKGALLVADDVGNTIWRATGVHP